MLRRKENIYDNDNEHVVHKYGRLKRKMKKYDLNNIPNDNYFSNNIEYKNYNKNNLGNINQKNLDNLTKDNSSINPKTKNIYTSYNYKNKDNYNLYNDYNDNNDYINNNNNNNYNYNYKINKKPIIRPSKSALNNLRRSKYNNYYNAESKKEKNNYLLCQNCINKSLIEEKRYKEELNKKLDIPEIYEDKYKNYSKNLIKEKVEQREKNIKEISDNYKKWNELNDKDKLINQYENSVNPLYQNNHNYAYEKFKKNYEKKQKLINDNYDKFQNYERSGIINYYNNYVNNDKCKPIEYGEYKEKQYDINNYRKDLDEQINYREKQKRREREEDIKRENQQYNSAIKNLENENKEKELKKKRMKEELIKGNLELINAKKMKKEKLNKEDLKYKEYYNQENIRYNNELLNEKNKQKKINKEFEIENQKNLSKIKRKKEEQMIEDEKYKYNDYSYEPPKEITAECSGCHKIYPKKLLTPNAYFYGNFKNNYN